MQLGQAPSRAKGANVCFLLTGIGCRVLNLAETGCFSATHCGMTTPVNGGSIDLSWSLIICASQPCLAWWHDAADGSVDQTFACCGSRDRRDASTRAPVASRAHCDASMLNVVCAIDEDTTSGPPTVTHPAYCVTLCRSPTRAMTHERPASNSSSSAQTSRMPFRNGGRHCRLR